MNYSTLFYIKNNSLFTVLWHKGDSAHTHTHKHTHKQSVNQINWQVTLYRCSLYTQILTKYSKKHSILCTNLNMYNSDCLQANWPPTL